MRDGYRYECQRCRRAQSRARPENHPSRVREREKNRGRPVNDPTRVRERENRRRRYLAKYDTIRAQQNARKFMRKYGITRTDRDLRLAAQGNVCAICQTDNWTKAGPSVDHCHRTYLVRGILCNRCNAAIGFFLEDTERLYKAIRYLQHWLDLHPVT
jgi:hypothetical protein